MKIEKFVNGRWKENCYLVCSNGKAIVIDPGGSFDQMQDFFTRNSLEVLAVINTHAHFDHIVEVAELVREYKCPFYLHSKDERLLKSANFYMKLFEGEKKIAIPTVDFYLDKLESPIRIGDFSIEVMSTPGHTKGSVSFLIGQNLFTGDTVLKGTLGRVDLPGANKEELKESIGMISNLPSDLIIYPGHGDPTTIGEELTSNEHLARLLA